MGALFVFGDNVDKAAKKEQPSAVSATAEPAIRKAEMSDRAAIHAAHMRSIREICVKDHGPEEIKGWGFRELGDRWIEGINNGLVWVVEHRGQIHGVGSIRFSEDGNDNSHSVPP